MYILLFIIYGYASFFNCIFRAVSHGEILALYTRYAPISHRFRLADVRLDKSSVLLKDESDTQQKYRNSDDYQAKEKHFQHNFLSLQLQFSCKDKC